jgi:hypothetical protein
MKNVTILSYDKESFERLRALVNLLFPEVDVFCLSDSGRKSEKWPGDLDPNCSPVSRGTDPCRS